ncbi:MAG: TetR family transcriptional regulator [Anaerolineales bacterium]
MSRSVLITAAVNVLAHEGLTRCSVQAVAARAGCAKGLMNYHFRSKHELLAAVAARLAHDRAEGRLQALRTHGTRGLDALWEVLVDEIASGEARAWMALLVERRIPRDLHLEARVADAAAAALRLPPGSVPPDALVAGLDGLQLRLIQGCDPVTLRDTYDRLWLSLVPE